MADSQLTKAALNNHRDAYILESLVEFYRASDVLAKAPCLQPQRPSISPMSGPPVMSNLTKAMKRPSDSGDSCSSSMTIMTLTPTPRSSVNSISIEMSETSEFDESVVSDISDSSDNESNCSSKELLRRHIIQQYSLNPAIHFDTVAITESNDKIIAVSSKPLRSGVHEWTLQIVDCDVEIAEIGVCSVCDIEDIQIGDGGVTETVALGARAVYGNELGTDSTWYASYNEDGRRRCFKDLKDSHPIGWTSKDQIKVVLDLDKWRIKFYRNGKMVCGNVNQSDYSLFCT